jgi:hypothetical protein
MELQLTKFNSNTTTAIDKDATDDRDQGCANNKSLSNLIFAFNFLNGQLRVPATPQYNF